MVHIVDDDPSFRTAIADLLRACGYRVALYESAMMLLERPPADEPACILLDVRMSGTSGPQLQDQLAELGIRVPIIFVTGYGDIATAVQVIKTGAEDVLTKPVGKEQLLETIERALMHGEQVREQETRVVVLRSLVSRLSPREYDIFALLARGKLHKQIAYELNVSERTVKSHRRNVLQKLQVRSLADVAVIADRLGLLSESNGANALQGSYRPVGRKDDFKRRSAADGG